jgi:hypothetical protein
MKETDDIRARGGPPKRSPRAIYRRLSQKQASTVPLRKWRRPSRSSSSRFVCSARVMSPALERRRVNLRTELVHLAHSRFGSFEVSWELLWRFAPEHVSEQITSFCGTQP